ncbi:restriction endonuclease subunit S [Nostoc sp. C110]|uniref:restriction endonuclease subunit S n=1 Tax=Nostoc sp. C110 TaxID=3349876 RepID=UPI00370D3CF2
MKQSTWQVSKLSDVVGKDGLFIDGDWVESKDQDPNGDVRLTQLADIGVGEFLNRSSRFLTLEKSAELNCTFLEPGDILVARMPDPIGRACIFPGDTRPCVTVVDVCIIRPDQNLIYNKWLMWVLNSPPFQHQLIPYLSGTTRQRISRRNLQNLGLRIPPLEEQHRIAVILDKADAVRRKRQEAIALTEELLRSAFLEIFGDPATNPKGWKVVDLGNHLSFVTSGPRGWAKYYSDNGERFIRSLDVRMNFISDSDAVFVNAPNNSEAKRARVEDGDVLLTMTGSRIGRVAPVPKGFGTAYISQHVSILRPRQTISPQYLSFFLSTPSGGQRQIASMQYGQTKPGLNLNQVCSFQVPLPPMEKQQHFNAFWLCYQFALTNQTTALTRDEDLFNSLLQRAFRGEL